MTTITATDTFDAMYGRTDWLGFGYLGGRRNARDPESTLPDAEQVVRDADRLVAAHAAAHKWSDADLFRWANSKGGRWYADLVLDTGGTVEDRHAQAVRHGHLRLPR